MICNICNAGTMPFASAQVLSKYTVDYYRCPDCGFVQTQVPFWLEEAYTSPIVDTDTGLVGRNILSARVVLSLLKAGLMRGPVVDYAGGYGLLTRILRDHRVDCDWQDAYCRNIFANEFLFDPNKKYGSVTSFEAIEHQQDPVQFMERLLAIAPTVLISTVLLPSPVPRPGEWWYYNLSSGQHISFFSCSALTRMAARLGVGHVSSGEIHLFSREPVNRVLFNFFLRSGIRKLSAGLY